MPLSYKAGLAWGYKQFADELGCHKFFNSGNTPLNDPRRLRILRPAYTEYDWQANFYGDVSVNWNGGPVVLGNEPDNADFLPEGIPAGDDISPLDYTSFLVGVIQRYPTIQFGGPNIVRQDGWLDEFLRAWRDYGWPLTGRQDPFRTPGHPSRWSCHVYGNGLNYAANYVGWFVNKVQSFGHNFEYLWVSEYCSHDEDELRTWTEWLENYTTKPLWYAVFSPWLEESTALKEAYLEGRS